MPIIGGEPTEQTIPTPDWDLYSIGTNFAAGYLQGLTTFDLIKADSPDTVPEYIARSIGSVMGFIGIFPGSGALAKVGLTAVGRAARLIGEAAAAESYLAKAASIVVRNRSVPTVLGGWLSKKAMDTLFESSAAKGLISFADQLAARKLVGSAGSTFVRATIESASFMGFASAVGAAPINPLQFFTSEDWKARSEGFLSGAIFGAAQSTVANIVSKNLLEKVGFKSFGAWAEAEPAKADMVLKSLRAVTAGVTMATWTGYNQDVPSEYALYEGLLNAYFGYREPPASMRAADRLIRKHVTNSYDAIKFAQFHNDPVEFMTERGERFSPETGRELKIAKERYWGNKIYVDQAMREAIYTLAAERNGITLKELMEMPPRDRHAMVYEMNPSLGIQFLHEDSMEQVFREKSTQKIKDFAEVNLRSPNAEELRVLENDALGEAGEELYKNFVGVAEYVKDTARKIHLHREYNQLTADQFTAIEDNFRQTGVPHTVMNVIKEMSHDLLSNNIDVVKAVQTIGSIFKAEKAQEKPNFVAVKTLLESRLGIKLTPELTNKFSQLWHYYSGSITVNEYSYDPEQNYSFPSPSLRRDGSQRLERRGLSPYEEFFKSILYEVKTISGMIGRGSWAERGVWEPYWIKPKWTPENKGKSIKKQLNFNRLLHAEYQNGHLFVGGDKADHRLLFEDRRGIEYDNETETYSYVHPTTGEKYSIQLNEAIEQVHRLDSPEGNGLEVYRKFRDQYIEDNKDVPNTSKEALAAEYDLNTANRALKLMAMNSQSELNAIFSDRESFSISSAFAYTKRMQLLVDGSVALTPADLENRSMRGVVVENSPLSQYTYNEFGNAHNDGALVLNPKSILRKALLNVTGQSEKSALSKFTISAFLKTGYFTGKLASHLGTPEMEKIFAQMNEPDFILFKSVAKQTGKIPVAQMRWDGERVLLDELPVNEDLLKQLTFEVDARSFRVNPSAKEDEAMSPGRVMKQIMENVGNDPEMNEHLKQTLILPELLGDENANKAFKTLDENPKAEVNVDDVSLQNIVNTLQGENFAKGGEPFKRVIKRLFKYQLEHGDEMDETDGELTEIRELQKARTYVDLIIAAVGEDGITPALVRSPVFREYTEAVLYKYMKDRLQRPRWRNSARAIGYYGMTEPDMQKWMEANNNQKFQPGNILIGDGFRGFPVQLKGELAELLGRKSILLGELWKKRDIPQVQEFFDNFMTARAPQSDTSGSRRQKMRGFMKNGGYGVFLHPMDMHYSDGADMDIDAYKIYMGFDKKILDYIDRPEVKYRFSRWKPTGGVSIPLSPSDGLPGLNVADIASSRDLEGVLKDGRDSKGVFWQETFQTSKGKNPLLGEDGDYSFYKSRLSTIIPGALADANRLAATGKDTLGPGLTAMLRARQVWNFMTANGIDKLSFEKRDISEEPWEWEGFHIRPKKDLRDWEQTKVEIVNNAADSADGYPIADIEQIRVAAVLSAVDLYEGNRKIEGKELKTLAKVLASEPGGYKNFPVIDSFLQIDNALRLRDRDGNRKTLFDSLNELRSAVQDAKQGTGIKGSTGSIWYDTAEMLSNIKYEPSALDYVNIRSRKVVSEFFNTIVKTRFGEPGVELLYSAMGRRGISFNLSKVTDTLVWGEVLGLINKNPTKYNEKDLFNDFIRPPEGDFRKSKLWEIVKRLPAPNGDIVNRQEELFNQLAWASDVSNSKSEKVQNVVKYDKEKHSVRYSFTNKEKKLVYVHKVFPSLAAAEEYVESVKYPGSKTDYVILQDVEKTPGQQIATATDMHINDMHDATSFVLMHDTIVDYVAKRLPDKKLNDEEVVNLVNKEIAPLLEKVTEFKRRLRSSQLGIHDAIGSYRKQKSFQNMKDVVEETMEFRSKLTPEAQVLFDAAYVSSLHANEEPPNFDFIVREQMKYMDVREGDEKTVFEKLKDEMISDWRSQNYRFATMRGRTPFTVGVVDPSMVTEYFKRFNLIGTEMAKPAEEIVTAQLAKDFNVDVMNMFKPNFIANNPEIAQIEQPRKEALAFMKFFSSPLKGFLLKEWGNDGLGGIKNPVERARYTKLRDDLVEAWRKHPEQLNEFVWRYPMEMAKIYGPAYKWTPDMATLDDLRLYIDGLNGHLGKLEGKPRILKRWFFQKFGYIAKIAEEWQQRGKMDLKIAAHVLTSAGPRENMNVKTTIGHFQVAKMLADAVTTDKNTMEEGQIIPYWFDAFQTQTRLDRDYDGLGAKLVETAISIIEEPLRERHLPESERHDGWKLYDDAFQKAVVTLADYQNKEFMVNTPDGKVVKMDARQITDYFIRHLRHFQTYMQSEMTKRPDDDVIVFTGRMMGKQRMPEVDVRKTMEAIIAKIIDRGYRMPDISLKYRTMLARQMKLDEKEFEFYRASGELYVAPELSDSKRKRFDTLVEGKFPGYEKYTRRWTDKEMTDVERDLVVDEVYKKGRVDGFDPNEDVTPLKDAWIHHYTSSEKVKNDHARKIFTSRFTNFTAEEAQEYSIKAIRYALNTSTDSNDPEAGARMFNSLYDKDSFNTMHFTPSFLKERDLNMPLPVWERTLSSQVLAHRQMLKQKADALYAMTAKWFADDVKKRQVFGLEQSIHFGNFLERYARQTLGLLDTTPYEAGEGYTYGMSTNVFKFWSDSTWRNRVQKIADTWFGGKVWSEYKHLEDMSKKLPFEDEKKRKKWVEDGKKVLSEQKITWASHAEAKWSLMSLLASSRTMVTNLTTAEIMTFVNAGKEAFTKSFGIENIQEVVGKDRIRSWADVMHLLGELGGLESFLSTDFNIQGDSTLKKTSETFKLLAERLAQAQKDGKPLSDVDAKGILSETGLMDKVVSGASWFMRKSERIARQHSMIAHYLNAHRVLKQAGFQLEYDDPWVMQITREGVKASQFLYANSERPAFMATAMGKIFHRFQLFAYNSVEFRKNVYDQMRLVGEVPGSEATERFNRMFVSDLFVFGMAGLMPFTIFGSTLMPPYTWLQGTLNYFFGTSDEKKRAFFGGLEYPASPLNVVVPPGLREIPQLFSLAFGSDQKTIGDIVGSWMPFQRIAKETYKTIQNPAMIFDNYTGYPIVQWPQMQKKTADPHGLYRYLDSFRSSLNDNKKRQADIQSYLDLMPALPETLPEK